MRARTSRFVTAVTVAAFIIALATFGGYRLGSSGTAVPSHVRVAASLPSAWADIVHGNDLNDVSPNFCQVQTPCQNLQVAYNLVQPGGVLGTGSPGPYSALNIDHSITVDGGGGGNTTILGQGADGIEISAGASDTVILRHLRISNFGGGSNAVGIRFISGKNLILNDVDIEGFTNGVSASLSTGGQNITIVNSRIHRNSSAGVAVTTSSGTVHVNIGHSSIQNNTYGIINGDGVVLDLSNSVIADNTSIGLGAQTFGLLSSLVHATHNQFDNNPYAVWENHGAGNAQIIVWLSDNDIVNNTTGIYGNTGGTLAVFSFGNNRLANNATPGGVNGVASQT